MQCRVQPSAVSETLTSCASTQFTALPLVLVVICVGRNGTFFIYFYFYVLLQLREFIAAGPYSCYHSTGILRHFHGRVRQCQMYTVRYRRCHGVWSQALSGDSHCQVHAFPWYLESGNVRSFSLSDTGVAMVSRVRQCPVILTVRYRHCHGV